MSGDNPERLRCDSGAEWHGIPTHEHEFFEIDTPAAPLTALALPEDDVPDAAPEVK